MREKAVLALIGDVNSRISFVNNYLKMLAMNIVFHDVEITLVDERSSQLDSVSRYGFIKNYVVDTNEAVELVDECCDEYMEYISSDRADECKVLLINNFDVIKKN